MRFHSIAKPTSAPEFGFPTYLVRGYNSGIYARSGEIDPNKLGGGQRHSETYPKDSEDNFQPAKKTTPEDLEISTKNIGSPIISTVAHENKSHWLQKTSEEFLQDHDHLVAGARELFLPPNSWRRITGYLTAITTIVSALVYYSITGLDISFLLTTGISFLMIAYAWLSSSGIITDFENRIKTKQTIGTIQKKGIVSFLAEQEYYSEILVFFESYVKTKLEQKSNWVEQAKIDRQERLLQVKSDTEKHRFVENTLNNLKTKEKEYAKLQTELQDTITALKRYLQNHPDEKDNDITTLLMDMQNRLFKE